MAQNAFLTLDGIKGESAMDGHKDEIEILSFSFGGSNPASVGRGGGAGTGSVTLDRFQCVKYVDASSAGIFQNLCLGRHFPKAKLTVYKASGGAPLPYLVYDFEEVFVDNQQWSGVGNGADSPTESLSFAFRKVVVTYNQQKPDGSKGGAFVASWDIASQTK
jgi:type VI secretion system secreted protein Hcp